MTRAAIYVRVSTARQAERDLSIPDQIVQCRTWCARQGIEVVRVFSEPGASALDEDRPVFQEMIHTAKRSDKPFDLVVVHSLSRFSRDSLHSELYIRELRKAGVELVSITQEVGQDPTGEMFRKLLHIFDEHQSRETAKHVHRAMLENARQGFWNGSRPPYVLDKPCDEGWAIVNQTRSDAAFRAGAMDNPAEANGGAGCRQRRGLGPARPSAPGSRQSRSSARRRRDAG